MRGSAFTDLHCRLPAGYQKQRLECFLPKNREWERLRERAQTDNEAMLQLADATRFGIAGCHKDEMMASKCYSSAAWGTRLYQQVMGMLGFSSSEYRTPPEQANTAFKQKGRLVSGGMVARVEVLKQKGNKFFSRQRLQAAQTCYSEAIDLIKASTNGNNEAFKLLGTLLSNGAACCLKMSENTSHESAKDLLKRAEINCTNALKSPFNGVIRTKLERQRSAEARRRIKNLGCRYPCSTEISLLLPLPMNFEARNGSLRRLPVEVGTVEGFGKNETAAVTEEAPAEKTS